MAQKYLKAAWLCCCFIVLAICGECMSTIVDGNRMSTSIAALKQLRSDIYKENWSGGGNFALVNHLLGILAKQKEQALKKEQKKHALRKEQEKQTLIHIQAKQAVRDELEKQIYRTHLASSRVSSSAILRDFLTMRF